MTTKIDNHYQQTEMIPSPQYFCSKIRKHVQQIVASCTNDEVQIQLQLNQRYPFPQLLLMTPVDPISLLPIDDTISVACKDISIGGLCFYHQTPIAHQLVIVGLESQWVEKLDVLLDLRWCRFTKHRWYESGGQFLQSMDLNQAG